MLGEAGAEYKRRNPANFKVPCASDRTVLVVSVVGVMKVGVGVGAGAGVDVEAAGSTTETCRIAGGSGVCVCMCNTMGVLCCVVAVVGCGCLVREIRSGT